MKSNLIRTVQIFSLTLFLLAPSVASAHPGRTNVYGCHVCRTNCRQWELRNGEYHCHKAKKLPQPKLPIKNKLHR